MRKGWEVKELGAVSAINYGYTESASSEPVGPRFLRITDIQNDCVDWECVPYCKIKSADVPKYSLAGGDIVFARTGATTGKSFLVDDPPDAVFASYLIRLRLLDKKLLPEFVSLFFQTAGYWKSIKEGSAGSAQGGFNASKLGALSIPIPPLPEQHRIVGILDEAFDGIATAKANAQKNLQNTSELFHAHLNELFIQGGEGWSNCRFGDVVTQSRGGISIKSTEYSSHGFPVLTKGDVKRMGRVEHGGKFVDEAYLNAQRWPVADPGDMIVTTRDLKPSAPFLGLVARVPADRTYLINQGATFFKINQEMVNPDYFVFWCSCRQFREHVISKKSGSTQVHIREQDLFSAPLTIPPMRQQRAIVDKLDTLFTETRRLESVYQKKLAAMDTLKQSLLQHAFAGGL